MWQTLFVIPEQIGPLPVFGWGWALIVWCVATCISLLIVGRNYGWSHAVSSLPFALLVAAALVFVLPMLQVERFLPDGTRQYGLAIRGYGIMLLIAVVAGVGLAVSRAERRGLSGDLILSLATWMFALGIVGARLLYIGLYWDEYRQQSLVSLFGGVLNLSQGGLVVYGALFGALLAFVLFVRRHRLPALVLADIIAPCMLLGLAIGRIGCLLNGCCYGGPCSYPWAVQFPPESVPYVEQLRDGTVHGFHWQHTTSGIQVTRVDGLSQIGQAGLVAGDQIIRVNGRSVLDASVDPASMMAGLVELAGTELTLTTDDGRDISSTIAQLPDHSTALHPTQLYSSITAFLLLGFLLALEPYLNRSGQLFTTLITIYPVARFLLEVIRTDETAFAATGLTISQNISVLLLLFACSLWYYISKQPTGHIEFAPSASN
jgi:phosphatidylglycerol:prolipoprotein diacylglycerol transferase